MPNWVATVVEFAEAEQDIQAVFREISSEDTQFDFNKIIPMPKSLEIESGTHSDLAYAYYHIKTFGSLPARKCSYYKNETEVVKRVEEDTRVSPENMLNMGKTLHENIQKYGAPTWYEWCCDNWGTKWNACDANISDNTLYFNTAWSFAEPVMQKLAELCAAHRVGFEGEWADEDMGSNTGGFEASGDGDFYYEYYDMCSSKAYSAYVRCNGESICLDVDSNGDYYRHECNESCPKYHECMG